MGVTEHSMTIYLEQTGKKGGGKFDCVATVQAVREKLQGSMPNYSQLYNGANNKGLEVNCPNKAVTEGDISSFEGASGNSTGLFGGSSGNSTGLAEG